MKLFVVLISSLLIISNVTPQQESTRTGNRDYNHVLLSNVSLPQHDKDWKPVEAVFGRNGTLQGDVFKVTFPRYDFRVRVGTLVIEPALALTSWIAFKPMATDTMV